MMSFYIIYIHFLYWFSCTKMADTPMLTLVLHRDLREWKSRDRIGSLAAVKKIDLHTWYLCGRSVILALASDQVDDATKQAMATALLQQPNSKVECGKPTLPHVYEESTLPDFVNGESWLFFQVCRKL